MKLILLSITSLLILNNGFSQPITSDSLYLGKTKPGSNPIVFLSGITERICVSSDGKDIFYNSSNGLGYYHYSDTGWNGPDALFTGFGEASLSLNDSILYVQNSQTDSYYSLKNDTGWSQPVKLWSNNSASKHQLQVTNSRTFYATTSHILSTRGDISKIIINDSDISFESLPFPINSSLNGVDFYMAKDESYIIFPEISTVHGAFGGDLFISFKNFDESWTEPIDLGSNINTSDWEYGPFISPDNKYLFFSRSTANSTFWVKIDDLIANLKPTSINQTHQQNIQVFPNPTRDMINISFGSLQYKTVIIEITDISGKLVSSDTYHSLSNATIDLISNPNGIYILNLNIDGDAINKKICIE